MFVACFGDFVRVSGLRLRRQFNGAFALGQVSQQEPMRSCVTMIDALGSLARRRRVELLDGTVKGLIVFVEGCAGAKTMTTDALCYHTR